MESIVVPVAENKSTTKFTDLKSVALTSSVMKTFEHSIKESWLMTSGACLTRPDHPLIREFVLVSSVQRYRLPSAKSNRYIFDFIPNVIHLFNLL